MDPRLVALLEKGHARQLAGDLAVAEKSYLKVLRHDPNNEFALNLMGVVAIRKSDYKNATRYLKQALKVNSNDPETHSNLGLAYKELTRFAEAKRSFDSALKLDRNRAKDWNNLGNVLAATDQHPEAIRCFESALALDKTYVDCLNNLSVSLKEVGRLEHALQVIEHAIRTNPRHSLSHNNMGEVLLRATQYERAREAFERAIALDQSIVARINLSTALKQLGDDQTAVQTLKDVLTEEANNSEAWNHLGVLYEQLGDTPDWIGTLDTKSAEWTWQADNWKLETVAESLEIKFKQMYEAVNLNVANINDATFELNTDENGQIALRHDPRITAAMAKIGAYNTEQYLLEPLLLHHSDQDYYSIPAWNADLSKRINAIGGHARDMTYPGNTHSLLVSKHEWFSPRGTTQGFTDMLQLDLKMQNQFREAQIQ